MRVLYEKDCRRHGKVRVTEGTITIGTRTFPRDQLVDFDIRRPRLISFDTLFAMVVVVGTLLWVLAFALGVAHMPGNGRPGEGAPSRPGVVFLVVGSIAIVTALCLSGFSIRRARSFYWFSVRTTRGERFRTRFYGPDPELESVFERLLADRETASGPPYSSRL